MNSFLQNAKELLGQKNALPVLPASAQKIIESITDEFVELETVSSCIEEDPIISARIVGIANSLYYG